MYAAKQHRGDFNYVRRGGWGVISTAATHEWNMLSSMMRSLIETRSLANLRERGKLSGERMTSIALRPSGRHLFVTWAPLMATRE